MGQSTAKVIEHSVSGDGIELLTMQLRYPRLVHAEFMTHRVFSRNASSSRAIPVAKIIEQVRKDPAMPVHWGKNQPGMQAREENDALVLLEEAIEFDNPSDTPLFTFERSAMSVQDAWRRAANNAADVAEAMAAAGYHKQVVNRLLEPFQFISVIVTATEWGGFFELRDHEDADPTIGDLARVMREARNASTPVLRLAENYRTESGWHLPFISLEERLKWKDAPEHLAKLSTARCARVSYLNHDGSRPDPVKDLALFFALVGAEPLHASPTEHQGYPSDIPSEWCKNFKGWWQHRAGVEEGIRAQKILGQYEGSICD